MRPDSTTRSVAPQPPATNTAASWAANMWPVGLWSCIRDSRFFGPGAYFGAGSSMMASGPKPARPATKGTLTNHLAGRVDPLTSAILVFPLFIIYQLGILLSRGLNG